MGLNSCQADKLTFFLKTTKVFLIIFILEFLLWIVTGLASVINRNKVDPSDVDNPLFLTHLIKSGKFEMARNKSRVVWLPNAVEVENYSGYLTVNETFNSNIFFWFCWLSNKKDKVLFLLFKVTNRSTFLFFFESND